MAKLSLNLLCRLYLLAVLLVTTILSPLPYSLISLLLVAATLFFTLRPRLPRINVAVTVATVFLLPLALAAALQYLSYAASLPLMAIQLLAAVAGIPAFYVLDHALRQIIPDLTFTAYREGRFITVIPRTIFIAAMVMLLFSFVLSSRVLLFTSIMIILYLLAILGHVLRAVPRQPLDIPAASRRIIARSAGDVPLVAASRAAVTLYCRLMPQDSWVKIDRPLFRLGKVKTELNITVTPPLAGPAHPRLQASVIDPWGFLQVNQVLEPLELHVIPRAKYAEWLAMRYLEQAGYGMIVPAVLPPEEIIIPKRGIEYYTSRDYQPGDRLKDIDWRHTLKLGQLITKEYTDVGGQSAIIAVNLAVADAEGADRLAFKLITTALTLARRVIPTALAAYDEERVVMVSALSDSRDMLKQALSLVKEISIVAAAPRHLQPASIGRLRRNITQLKQATSEPAKQLLGLLDFEYRAIEQAAKNSPATQALSQVSRQVLPPAIIILLSQLDNDSELLEMTMERLRGRGFHTLSIGEAGF